ncbi:MAG: hypothetical protein A3C82_02760 [Candidatus Wildermuthbacteria bacterium RIFCSPHIGHO2_02_FULL_47_12]|uniref:Uncharacterized protein n=1 Tax=Candidatus Wildermuthbacteria bacterium RIFCSPHIGHO2_02_FULL_47_12 TaxID=1802451 RepID=A0A1G2R2Z9_9BACT|nr:MAG: hypothetical protein A3C82_02760 [Candidatus Wildermuthbacteria bacterium RIFCSPHIGHO2_02_FULL_47_12]
MTQVNPIQEELVHSLRGIAEQMRQGDPDGSYSGLAALRALLVRHEFVYDMTSVSANLAPRVLTLLWLLQQFVNRDLWRTFGGNNTGFPEDEGKPIIYQISHDLGEFILWCLNEGEVPFSSLGSVLELYFRLLRVAESAHKNSNPKTQWVTL